MAGEISWTSKEQSTDDHWIILKQLKEGNHTGKREMSRGTIVIIGATCEALQCIGMCWECCDTGWNLAEHVGIHWNASTIAKKREGPRRKVEKVE